MPGRTRSDARPQRRPHRADAEPRANAHLRPSPVPHRLALVVACACVLYSVSFRLYEYDVWEHLAYGRALWQLHHVPQVQMWTWPDLGTPHVNPSWGFSALVWP